MFRVVIILLYVNECLVSRNCMSTLTTCVCYVQPSHTQYILYGRYLRWRQFCCTIFGLNLADLKSLLFFFNVL